MCSYFNPYELIFNSQNSPQAHCQKKLSGCSEPKTQPLILEIHQPVSSTEVIQPSHQPKLPPGGRWFLTCNNIYALQRCITTLNQEKKYSYDNPDRRPQFSNQARAIKRSAASDFGLTPPNDLQTTGTKSTPIRLHVSRYWRVFWRIMALEAKRNLNSFQQQMNNTIRSLKEKYCNQSNTEKLSIQNSLLCIKFLKFLIQYTQYIQHSTTYYTTWYNVNNKCVIKKFNLISICNNIKTQHVYCQNKINMTVYVNQ
eukprot:TRINITY_DN605_c0_g2_i6.p2 TRINITY_DN605_c0_g2~~TRINITY_DN605_c0_g2_i6.p2  ORF type:complete len:255 (-),score=-8.04 TRINITY_DN605_c0_g2_i6:801-1565(-)